MKAAFLVKVGNSAEAFQIKETNKPVIKKNEVLIKVETFGLNYADVMARNGIYAAAPPLPSILGYEVVGTISEVGTEITNYKVGDRVLGFTRFGGYAEYCSAHHLAVVKLPSEIPNDMATALATQYCTAIYAADWIANIRKNEKILVHAAAGGVGHALIQYAKNKGAYVLGTAGSDEKIQYLDKLGVDFTINYSKQNFNSIIKEEFGDRPINVIFDPIGGKNHKLNRELLAVGGRMVIYGISSFSKKKGSWLDKLQLAAQFGILSPLEFLIKSNGVIGVNMLHVASENPGVIHELLSDAVYGYQKGVYQPKIAFHGSVNEIGKAHDMLENRGTIGKLCLSW